MKQNPFCRTENLSGVEKNAFAVASLLPLQGPKSFGGAKPQIVFPASGFFSSLGRRDIECVSFPPWRGAGAPGQGLPVHSSHGVQLRDMVMHGKRATRATLLEDGLAVEPWVLSK